MNTHINEFGKTSELIDSLTDKTVEMPYVANITGRDYVNYDEIDLTQPFTIEIGDTIPQYDSVPINDLSIKIDNDSSFDYSSVISQLRLYVKKNDEDWVEYSNFTYPRVKLFSCSYADENGNIVDYSWPNGSNYKLSLNKGDKFQIKANFGIFNDLFTGSTKPTIIIGSTRFMIDGYSYLSNICTFKVYGNIQSLFNLDYDTNFDYSNTSNFKLNADTFDGNYIYEGSTWYGFKSVITDYSGLIIAGDFYSYESLFDNMFQNYQYWNVYNVESSGPNTYSNSKYEKSPIVLSNIGAVTIGPQELFNHFENVRLYSPNLIGVGEPILASDNTVYIRTDAENIPSSWENNNKVIKD